MLKFNPGINKQGLSYNSRVRTMKYFIILVNQNSKMNIQILTLETWGLNITVQAVISINLPENMMV